MTVQPISVPTSTAFPAPPPVPPPAPRTPPPPPRDLRTHLLDSGAASLSTEELLAVLLGTGRPGGPEGALGQARALLVAATHQPAVLRDRLRLEHRGLPASAVTAVLATMELACRVARERVPRREPLAHLDELARYLTLRYARVDQEVTGAVYLDPRGSIVGDEELFVGTVSRCCVEPRAILVSALERHAAGLLLFHTHPSGDPTPSAEDVLFTRRMKASCRVVGVDFRGHLVLGGGGRWQEIGE